MFDNQTSRCLFRKKFQKNCQVIPFWCCKSSKRRDFNFTKSNGSNLFSRIRGIAEQGLGLLFITLSSSYFYKTNFEQHLFGGQFFFV